MPETYRVCKVTIPLNIAVPENFRSFSISNTFYESFKMADTDKFPEIIDDNRKRTRLLHNLYTP